MVFDAIVSHLVNTFGEYPYLTLNAYNPWALVDGRATAAHGPEPGLGSATRPWTSPSRS